MINYNNFKNIVHHLLVTVGIQKKLFSQKLRGKFLKQPEIT